MEVCCTLGMLSESQAQRLKEAGLTAYNHNLDTSPEFYGEIITTRVYEDRLRTIAHVRKAGITVCCGGILGMGETEEDRIGLLQQLANLESASGKRADQHAGARGGNAAGECGGPGSACDGANDCHGANSDAGVARAAGGGTAADVARSVALCFLAGANSIFTGEKLAHHSQSRRGRRSRHCSKIWA